MACTTPSELSVAAPPANGSPPARACAADASPDQHTVASSPGFSGQGLNLLTYEADACHRLLNLTPTPMWYYTRPSSGLGKHGTWGAGYSLSPAIEVWAERVREANTVEPARVVGVVGATSAGKSWLVGKLLGERSPKPSRLEEQFDGMTLQSMTSDINLYADAEHHTYYLDFEGTYGTQPLQGGAPDCASVMERCPDPRAWEGKRRQSLKECFQPAVAYLTCNVVVFVTREKLVCSRAIEECEHFARAANGRVVSALPPALILVQNCCRPSEGIFNPEQCTSAFMRTHMAGGGDLEWQSYFRSIDCFCIPDEYLVCKRSGFDGEVVCRDIVKKLRETLQERLEEDLVFRLQHQVRLSQLQWFSVVSALCRIVNDSETVKMSSLYMHVGATTGGLGELKSTLLLLMSGKVKCNTVEEQIQVALGMIARFAVRRELSRDELEHLLAYLQSLFPCGAHASDHVVCFHQPDHPVVCGQMRLFHSSLHRSGTLVRTVDADWLQGLGEWLRGGITHAWMGDFECHPSFAPFDDHNRLRQELNEEIEAYKLQKCLEGLSPEVGSPWVLKAYASLQRVSMKIQKDVSRMCIICMSKGVDLNFFSRMWVPSEGTHLPACQHCCSILEKHNLCRPDAGTDQAWDQGCDACARRDPWLAVRNPARERQNADHRLFPCRCSVCKLCAESLIKLDNPSCQLCGQPVRWMVDERALVQSSWSASVRRGRGGQAHERSCDTCASGRK